MNADARKASCWMLFYYGWKTNYDFGLCSLNGWKQHEMVLIIPSMFIGRERSHFRADSNQTPEQVSCRNYIPKFHNFQPTMDSIIGKSRLVTGKNRAVWTDYAPRKPTRDRKYPKAPGKQWGYYFSNVAMRTKGIWWELFGNLVGTKRYRRMGNWLEQRGIWWEFLGTKEIFHPRSNRMGCTESSGRPTNESQCWYLVRSTLNR